MTKHYIILFISIGLIYYFLFKFDYDKKFKRLMLLVSVLAFLSQLLSIIDVYFPSYTPLLDKIFFAPIAIAFIIFMFFLFKYIWPLRKHPQVGKMVYVAYGFLILTFIMVIVIFILYQFGFFG